MGGGLLSDNALPYAVSRAPERGLDQVYVPVSMLREHHPSYAMGEPYVPVQPEPQQQQYYELLPREQGQVFPKEQMYRVLPRGKSFVPQGPAYRVIQPREQPYASSARQPFVEMLPVSNGGYRQRSYHAPAGFVPGEQVYTYPYNAYGAASPQGMAFSPNYAGEVEPEPIEDVRLMRGQFPERCVAAPMREHFMPYHAAASPHFSYCEGPGLDPKVCALGDAVSPLKVSGNLHDVKEKSVPSVRTIPVMDLSDGLKESQKKAGAACHKQSDDGNARQKKDVSVSPSKSRTNSPSREGQEKSPTLLRKGFLIPSHKQSSPDSESVAADAKNTSNTEAVSGNSNKNRVVTAPLASLEDGKMEDLFKMLMEAMLKGQSKEDKKAKAPESKEDKIQVEDKLQVSEIQPRTPDMAAAKDQDECVDSKTEEIEATVVHDPKAGCHPEGGNAVARKMMSEEEAATKIQAVFKGYSLRRTSPLEKARGIARVQSKLGDIITKLADHDTVAILRKDSKERLKLTETLMALLLELDAIQGVHSTVRDLRKALAHDITRLQDELDAKLRVAPVSSDNNERIGEKASEAVPVCSEQLSTAVDVEENSSTEGEQEGCTQQSRTVQLASPISGTTNPQGTDGMVEVVHHSSEMVPTVEGSQRKTESEAGLLNDAHSEPVSKKLDGTDSDLVGHSAEPALFDSLEVDPSNSVEQQIGDSVTTSTGDLRVRHEIVELREADVDVSKPASEGQNSGTSESAKIDSSKAHVGNEHLVAAKPTMLSKEALRSDVDISIETDTESLATAVSLADANHAPDVLFLEEASTVGEGEMSQNRGNDMKIMEVGNNEQATDMMVVDEASNDRSSCHYSTVPASSSISYFPSAPGAEEIGYRRATSSGIFETELRSEEAGSTGFRSTGEQSEIGQTLEDRYIATVESDNGEIGSFAITNVKDGYLLPLNVSQSPAEKSDTNKEFCARSADSVAQAHDAAALHSVADQAATADTSTVHRGQEEITVSTSPRQKYVFSEQVQVGMSRATATFEQSLPVALQGSADSADIVDKYEFLQVSPSSNGSWEVANNIRSVPAPEETMNHSSLMLKLIEDNRKLEALVHALLGQNESQSASIVKRLDKLEAKLSEAKVRKLRDNHSRKGAVGVGRRKK